MSVALPDGPVWVNADPTRLEQIIVNVMNNAAKFTDEGGASARAWYATTNGWSCE